MREHNDKGRFAEEFKHEAVKQVIERGQW
jgi:transposase-like protein